MTHKDFQLIADTLKANKPDPKRRVRMKQWESTVAIMAKELATTNDRFDAVRFTNACDYFVSPYGN
tara:strand:- start:345 stop:542 length:198 start_codon:yes stop_codon:yes gene_type:complete